MKRNRLLSVILTVLVGALLLGTVPVSAQEEEIVSVFLYESEDELIYMDVPKNAEEQVLEELQDPDKLQDYINAARKNKMLRTPGNCRYKNYTAAEMLVVIDKIDNSRNWLAYIDNPYSGFILGHALKFFQSNSVDALNGKGFFTSLAGMLLGGMNSMLSKRDAWWKDSHIMMSRGSIKGVRSELCENVSGSYPVAYRFMRRY